jgi:CubicO group peptidase (beta-lactamase class C family)
MPSLRDDVDAVAAETGFSGVVRVDRDGAPEVLAAYGLAERRAGTAMTVDTRLAIASGAKGLTALTVMRLVEGGALTLGTTARSLLGTDLPLVPDDVTVEHLLAHRSGIGDYLDEHAGHAIDDYVLAVPVHRLAATEDYLAVLDGHPPAFPAGSAFAYNNGGFVLLALLAERASGVAFHDLVAREVCEPAGMASTAYLRSDELPAGTATGYLDPTGLRTNVLHLPVRGSGDGGAYSTAADVHALWAALFAGEIVAEATLRAMTQPRSDVPANRMRYGLGFWLQASGPAVVLEGYDAGVSFRSVHDPEAGTTATVLANTSEGAWPIARLVAS